MIVIVMIVLLGNFILLVVMDDDDDDVEELVGWLLELVAMGVVTLSSSLSSLSNSPLCFLEEDARARPLPLPSTIDGMVSLD